MGRGNNISLWISPTLCQVQAQVGRRAGKQDEVLTARDILSKKCVPRVTLRAGRRGQLQDAEGASRVGGFQGWGAACFSNAQGPGSELVVQKSTHAIEVHRSGSWPEWTAAVPIPTNGWRCCAIFVGGGGGRLLLVVAAAGRVCVRVFVARVCVRV